MVSCLALTWWLLLRPSSRVTFWILIVFSMPPLRIVRGLPSTVTIFQEPDTRWMDLSCYAVRFYRFWPVKSTYSVLLRLECLPVRRWESLVMRTLPSACSLQLRLPVPTRFYSNTGDWVLEIEFETFCDRCVLEICYDIGLRIFIRCRLSRRQFKHQFGEGDQGLELQSRRFVSPFSDVCRNGLRVRSDLDTVHTDMTIKHILRALHSFAGRLCLGRLCRAWL